MKQLLKKTAVHFLYHTGMNTLCGRLLGHRLFVIAYHSVSDSRTDRDVSGELYLDLSVTTQKFEAQLLFLKKHGHTFFTFSELAAIRETQPRKPTLIYFDDGYKDNLLNAVPVLERQGVKATFFVSSGLTERTHFLWTIKHRVYMNSRNETPKRIEREILRLKSLKEDEREQELVHVYAEHHF